jgi:hypothetical protein
MGSLINKVPGNGVEWVGAVSEGGQPKSHITIFEQIYNKTRLSVKGKMLQRYGVQYNINVT